MRKDIDIKNRVVNMWDVDTGIYEEEIIKFLDKKMKIRFNSVSFNNSKYTFLGRPSEQVSKSITVSSYKVREANETSAVIIG